MLRLELVVSRRRFQHPKDAQNILEYHYSVVI
jgi:hypothetical protein